MGSRATKGNLVAASEKPERLRRAMRVEFQWTRPWTVARTLLSGKRQQEWRTRVTQICFEAAPRYSTGIGNMVHFPVERDLGGGGYG